MYMCIHMYPYACAYVCVCVCMCVCGLVLKVCRSTSTCRYNGSPRVPALWSVHFAALTAERIGDGVHISAHPHKHTHRRASCVRVRVQVRGGVSVDCCDAIDVFTNLLPRTHMHTRTNTLASAGFSDCCRRVY